MSDKLFMLAPREPILEEGTLINIGWYLWEVEELLHKYININELRKCQEDLIIYGSSIMKVDSPE